MILFVCDVERFSCRMIIHDLPSRRITCSGIRASSVYYNTKCIGNVTKTTIKLLKMHLNIKYFVQFLFLVVLQCHSCGFKQYCNYRFCQTSHVRCRLGTFLVFECHKWKGLWHNLMYLFFFTLMKVASASNVSDSLHRRTGQIL